MTGTADHGGSERLDREDAAALAARLRDETASPTVVALPDGSLDRRCRVRVGADRRVTTRAQLGTEVAAGGRKSVQVEVTAEDPGGQAVNLARQAHALGADTRLYGHLDGLPSFPFEARSMGAPAEIRVWQFTDGDLVIAERSDDIRTWSLEDLPAAAGDLDRVADADAVCWTNWVSIPGVAGSVTEFAERTDGDGAWFLADPGDVVGSDRDWFGAFREAFAAVAESYRTVLSVNPAELRAFATGFDAGESADGETDEEADGVRAMARTVRDATDATAVVSHGVDRSVAATPEGIAAAPNRNLASWARKTGGGDRFDAGLVYALSTGWDWDDALQLGNACASRYVATGATAGRGALAAWIEAGTSAQK